MKMSIVVKFVYLMLCIVSSRSITVRNGAYENFVIEIQKDISEDDCSQFISNLEVRFFFKIFCVIFMTVIEKKAMGNLILQQRSVLTACRVLIFVFLLHFTISERDFKITENI